MIVPTPSLQINIHFIRIARGDQWKIINKMIIYNINIRIEIHILSLHWMMKTLAILMSVKLEEGFLETLK